MDTLLKKDITVELRRSGLANLVVSIALIVVSSPVGAQVCAPQIEPELGDSAIYSGANFFLVEFDPETFPNDEVDSETGEAITGIRSAIEDGVAYGMATWSTSCSGSVANHFPAMIPNNGDFGNSIPLSIKYNPGRNPTPRDCPWPGAPQPRCVSPARTDLYEDRLGLGRPKRNSGIGGVPGWAALRVGKFLLRTLFS